MSASAALLRIQTYLASIFANMSHSHAATDISSAVLALDRHIASHSALQILRVNSANNALEAFTENRRAAAAADLTLTNTGQTVLALDLPTGNHRIELKFGLNPLAGTASRTLTFAFNFSGTRTQSRGVIVRPVVTNSSALATQSVATGYLGSTASYSGTHGNTAITEWTISLLWNVTVAGTFAFVADSGVSDGFVITAPYVVAQGY